MGVDGIMLKTDVVLSELNPTLVTFHLTEEVNSKKPRTLIKTSATTQFLLWLPKTRNTHKHALYNENRSTNERNCFHTLYYFNNWWESTFECANQDLRLES